MNIAEIENALDLTAFPAASHITTFRNKLRNKNNCTKGSIVGYLVKDGKLTSVRFFVLSKYYNCFSASQSCVIHKNVFK